MLVLTRNVGESIVLDNGVEVHVIRINGKQVRIGIKAPKSVEILRAELIEDGEEPKARQ